MTSRFYARTKDFSSLLFTEKDAVGLLQCTKSINLHGNAQTLTIEKVGHVVPEPSHHAMIAGLSVSM